MVRRGGGPEPTEWHSADFVRRWSETDALVDVLATPRNIAAALVVESGIAVERVVDLGAGSGVFLDTMLTAYPSASGTWVDSSGPMLERARRALAPHGDRVGFEVCDVRDVPSLPLAGADVIVSSRVIHHFDPATIHTLYTTAARALSPGGFFCTVDHFLAPGRWDARFRRVRGAFVPRTGPRPSHAHDAPPQTLEDHLRWLQEAGFETPGVPWRFFVTALIVARTPPGRGGGRVGRDQPGGTGSVTGSAPG